MGQYHKLINLDKKEFVDPHKLGLGLKQAEQSFVTGSIGDAVYILLALDNGKGGGDLGSPWHDDNGYFGRWVGDEIAVIGDYNMESKYKIAYDRSHSYEKDYCVPNCVHWTDISDEIVKVFEMNVPMKIVEQDEYDTTWRKRIESWK